MGGEKKEGEGTVERVLVVEKTAIRALKL